MNIKDEIMEAAKRIRDTAMHQTLAARIPESGHFGAIAQDADWLVDHLTAALPHMGGVSEEMLIAAFLRGESWRKRNDVDRYVAVPEMVEKAARDYADATLSALAPHEPTSEAQRGVEDAEERVAEIPSGTLLDDLPDEVLFGDHSYENPTVRQPTPEPEKDGPEVVERLRKWCSETINQWSDEYEPRENWERQVSGAMREWDKATIEIISNYEALRADNERLREFERQHDYCCCGSRMEDHDIGSGHSPVSVYDYQYDRAVTRAEAAEARNAELVKALEEIASDDERGDYEGVVQFARAAIGGQSNEA